MQCALLNMEIRIALFFMGGYSTNSSSFSDFELELYCSDFEPSVFSSVFLSFFSFVFSVSDFILSDFALFSTGCASTVGDGSCCALDGVVSAFAEGVCGIFSLID